MWEKERGKKKGIKTKGKGTIAMEKERIYKMFSCEKEKREKLKWVGKWRKKSYAEKRKRGKGKMKKKNKRKGKEIRNSRNISKLPGTKYVTQGHKCRMIMKEN